MNVGLPPNAIDRTAVLDVASFRRVADLAEREAGLAIPEAKRSMVQSRLNRRLRATGLGDFEKYLRLVESLDGLEERAQMISALTTNVSHFFREAHHFAALGDKIAQLISRGGRRPRIRIWSAGCSTGEEPYSIAITLIEAIPELDSLDVRILASDIDKRVLSKARAGIYQDRELSTLTASRRSRFFAQQEEGFCAREELRKLISFRQLNLVEQWPMTGPFDIIFCRNVLIYFSEDTQNALWPRFAGLLETGGTLFLGHSERISNPSQNGFQIGGVTTYIKPRRGS